MQTFVKTTLAGVALAGAVALAAGAATPATARDGDSHTLLVQLPSGAVEQIEYTGPIAPRVMLSAAPLEFSPRSDDPVFAAFERMTAMMDQQAASMLQQVAQMPAMAGPGLPPGVSGYSVVTTISDGHACTRSTEVSYGGRGMQPQTVSNVSGDCGAGAQQGNGPAAMPVPGEPAARPHTIRVRYDAPVRHHPLVNEAFYQHGQYPAD